MTVTAPTRSQPFRIGAWTVDPDAGTLEREGDVVRLQPKMVATLTVLAARPGQLVTKDDLLADVWDDAAVEEGALAQCIHALRKALGDDARQPTYIETIPRRGYRLIAAVREGTGEREGSSPEVDALAAAPSAPVPALHPRRRRYLPALLGLTLLVPLLFWSLDLTLPVTKSLLLSSTEATVPVPPTIVVLPPASDYETAIPLDGLVRLVYEELVRGGELRVISQLSRPLLEEGVPWQEQGIHDLGAGWAIWFVVEALPGDTSPDLQVELVEITDQAAISRERFVYPLEPNTSSRLPFKISKDIHQEFGYVVASRSRPDPDPEAFAFYLEGRALMDPARQADVEFDHETALEAVEKLQRAVEVDPGYPDAWAALSRQHSYLYFNTDQHEERHALALQALEKAQQLAPDQREVHLAEAYFHYHVERDSRAAFDAFERAAEGRPADREMLYGTGLVLRRQGDLDQAVERLEEAYRLDSQDDKLAGILAKTHIARRAYEKAETYSKYALSINPNLPQVAGDRTMNLMAWRGCPDDLQQPCSTREARELLANLEPAIEKKGFLSYFVFLLDLYDAGQLEGEARLDAYRAILSWLAEVPEEGAEEAIRNPQDDYTFFWRQVLLHRALGEEVEARELIARFRSRLESEVEEYPDYPYHHAYLAMVHALDGDAITARQFSNRAVELDADDLYSGPRQREFRAVTMMLLGDHDAALEDLGVLLETEYQYAITPMHLRLEPIWEPLRQDPRFVELLR